MARTYSALGVTCGHVKSIVPGPVVPSRSDPTTCSGTCMQRPSHGQVRLPSLEVETAPTDHVQVGTGHELDLERSPGSGRVEVPLNVAFLSDLLRGASYGVPAGITARRGFRTPDVEAQGERSVGGTGGDDGRRE